MKSRCFWVALTLGSGLVVALMLLIRPAPLVHADPGIYYVQEGDSIQQAINLATAPGDEVWVATGIYTENPTITHGVRLRGGWDISFTVQSPITYPTVIDGNGALVISVVGGGDLVSLEDFTLRNGQDGIHVLTGQVTVERFTIQDMNKQGLEIEDGTVIISATQIMTAQRGIEVDGGVVQVVNVHIAHVSEEGLLIERGGAVTFTSGIIEDCTQQGVQVNKGSLWLFDNLIRDIQVDGIHVAGGAVSIISNTIQATLADGVDVSGTQVISGNLVAGTGDHGISAHHGASLIVNNVVHDTGGDGIHTTNTSTGVEIRGNTVYSTGKDGIDGRGQTVTIVSNTVYNAGKDGVHIEDAGATYIQYNTIYDTNDDGIDARGTTVLVANNVVSGCADNGIKAGGVGNWVHIEANRVLSNATIGIAIRQAPVFTLTNNIVGGHAGGSVELGGAGVGFVYHNTLVGSGSGVQGTGLAVLAPLTVTLANNVVVSHNVGISATAGAGLNVSHTLLWGNGDDPISGTSVIIASPLFVAPTSQDYHLLPDSPAIDAGIDVGVLADVDGDPRPVGVLPDIGADETGILVSKRATAPVSPGAPLTYTICITNIGKVALTATITDILPSHVVPTGTFTWTPIIIAPDGVWTETVVVTVEIDRIGPLTNVVQVTTEEGATGIYTHVLTPDVDIAKRASTDRVQAGEPLLYTIYVTNTGDFVLHATVTDTLPDHVTPTGILTWTPTPIAPGGVWTETVVVTTAIDYEGPLTNVVQVATEEYVSDVYTETSYTSVWYSIYLPLILRAYQPGYLLNPGFEGITCAPNSAPGWCNDNWTHDTHDGGVYDDIFTPQGWVTWWREGYGSRPETKIIPRVHPFIDPLARIRSGNYAAMYFDYHTLQDGGFYQVVSGLVPGATVQFSAYAHGYSCGDNKNPGYSCSDPWNQWFQVGIEPDGVADPFSPNIIWSEEQTSPDYYGSLGFRGVGVMEARTCSGLPHHIPNKLGHPNPHHAKS